jgi:hypothetical protein
MIRISDQIYHKKKGVSPLFFVFFFIFTYFSSYLLLVLVLVLRLIRRSVDGVGRGVELARPAS